MKIFLLTTLLISAFIIFWAMIGYPLFLRFLMIFYRKKKHPTINFFPTVTLLIVAHNEENVIEKKLQNSITLDYPIDKFNICVSSDNSTDNTESIVKKFINNNRRYNIRLFCVKERKGKTNAQNEAVKSINTDFIVFTDANSIFKEDAILQLISFFSDEKVAYVCGKLAYVNDINCIAASENFYWENDLATRKIESTIKTITAGNGAIYACRKKDYINFSPIYSHDSVMPRYFATKKRKALYNDNAIAFEKAGENVKDEFKRKVRMNRIILWSTFTSLRFLNIFKYGWASIFFFGHRTARGLLWFMHLMTLVTSCLLYIFYNQYFFLIIFGAQILFYLIAIFVGIFNIKNKYLLLIYYYSITVLAQWVGVFKEITGKSKPFWEKAESTR